MFSAFWNNVILKLSGSMVFPHREMSEFALQLPPLKVQLDITSIHILCKCITSKDLMNSIIHQIDGSLGNQFCHQIAILKEFISWKLGCRTKRNIDLAEGKIITATRYTEIDIHNFTKKLWMMKSYKCIINRRSSVQDSIICESGGIRY